MGKDGNKNLMTIVALPYVWFQENSKEISFFFLRKMIFSCSVLLWKIQRKKLNVIEIN